MGASYPFPNLSHPQSILRGFQKRVAGEVPPVDPHYKFLLEIELDKWLETWIPPLNENQIFDFNEWLNDTNYPAWRKAELIDCYNETLDMPDPYLNPKVSEVNAFPKSERYPTFKEFRGIYSRSDYFKVLAGPIFKSIEHMLYSICTGVDGLITFEKDEKHTETFIKHVPVQDRAEHVIKKLNIDGCKFLATDYTAFEKHFTKEVMEMIEFRLYLHCFKSIPLQLLELMKIMGIISGTNEIRFKDFKAFLEACRMSGEMNTSLGNGFSNFFIFRFIMIMLNNTCYDGVFEGDDALACYVGTTPEEKHYAAIGFTCKIVTVYRISEASFCGLIFDPQDMISIADPIKILLNFGWSSDAYVGAGVRTRLQLLKGKTLSLIFQYPGVPVIQPFARKLLSLFNDRMKPNTSQFNRYYDKTLVALIEKGRIPSPRPILPRTRLLMEEVFGVTVDEQICLEQYFETFTEIPTSYHNDVILGHCSHNQRMFYDKFTSTSNKLVFEVIEQRMEDFE